MTVFARILDAAVLRMDSVVETIVEETAAMARDIHRTMSTRGLGKFEGKAGWVLRKRPLIDTLSRSSALALECMIMVNFS